jgi:Ankyrin repeats (many copies)/Ankyrin repeat
MQTIKLLVDADSCLVLRAFGPARGTPLHRAVVLCSRADVVKLLIRSGADADNTTLTGETPLMLSKDAAVSLVLLNAGAAVNARCSLGSTVLHAAAENGVSSGLICALLKAGADATATDTVGSTPAEVARTWGHTGAAALLQRVEVEQRSKQHHAAAAPLPDALSVPTRSRAWRHSSHIRRRRQVFFELLKEHIISSAAPQQLEFALYRTARSLEEYADLSTLQDRIFALEVQHSGDLHCEQYAVHVVSDTDSAVSSTAASAAAMQASRATRQQQQLQQLVHQHQQFVSADVTPSAEIRLSIEKQRAHARAVAREKLIAEETQTPQERVCSSNDSSSNNSNSSSSNSSSSTTASGSKAAEAAAAAAPDVAVAATSAIRGGALLAAYHTDASTAADTASTVSY